MIPKPHDEFVAYLRHPYLRARHQPSICDHATDKFVIAFDAIGNQRVFTHKDWIFRAVLKKGI